MSEETKVETKEEVKTESKEASATDAKAEESKSEETKADDFDYKAEFEKLQGKSEKEKFAWEKAKKELKDLKKELAELKGDSTEETEKGDVLKVMQEQFNSLKSELFSDKLDKEISSFTEDHYAKELVKANLEKYPGMSVEEAWFLANKGRLEGQISEAKKSVASSKRKGDGSGAGQKETKSTEPQLSVDNMKIIQRMGMKWDGKSFSKEGGKFALELQNGKLVQVKK